MTFHQIDDRVSEATVMVLDDTGKFLGSGFFVALRVVATCAHVVEKVTGRLSATHIVPGMSGSPVVDENGRVRGMLKAGAMRLGEAGSVTTSMVLRAFYKKHVPTLRTHMRSRPPLTRPRDGSELHRTLTASGRWPRTTRTGWLS
jgi:hypothetical protein